ncbi:MAG: VOC family protein [Pirellulales bacterium]
MPVIQPPSGAPCWFELSSTDPAKSFAFYRDLFGWQKFDMDLGPIGTYSFLSNSQGTVGALCSLQPAQQAHGVPSHWAVDIAVEDCDAATAQAQKLGGAVLMPPMNVSDYGRMSVVADPSGATFCLWQNRSTEGGDFVMFEDHAIGWSELATRDTAGARQFYGGLLGWAFHESKVPIPHGGVYTEIAVGETRYGGILPMSAEWGDIPPHWSIYIMTPDVDACVARTLVLGGQICVPPFEAPGVGRIAMIGDPTGAMTYVIQLAASASK